jgi:signal transduction histidine kinase
MDTLVSRPTKDIRVLLLEDNLADAELIKFALREGGLPSSLQRVENEEEFRLELQRVSPDLILSDYALPAYDGMAALTLAQEEAPDIPFIFVTGTLGEEIAIELLKSGATDYVLKTRLSRLIPSVHRALREAEERAERRHAEAELRKSHEQLRALSVYLQFVREEERTRIAREVHDELGQALTGLKLDLSWLAGRLPRDLRPLHQKLKDMAGHIDTTIHTVRRITTELRPGILDDLGLVAALEWQANEFQTRTGIACHFTTNVKDNALDPALNTAFFRVFQETLTNVIRHANAATVEVGLRREQDQLILEVHDNGRGIAKGESLNMTSLGLAGMRERASLLGGEFRITGAPGQGTTVHVAIPLRPRAAAESHTHENPHRRRPRRSAAGLETNPRG